MCEYPESVAQIVDDYLERVKERLRLVPPREQDEFLREIQSHIFEAFQEATGEDDVQRVLAVLRMWVRFGRIPAERYELRKPLR